jgi:DNA/RNA endonuclease YhcR with UshA esterase domain
MRSTVIVLVGLLAVAGAVPVSAHHAFTAEFDANAPVTLKGEVVKVEWTNPHAWLHINVKGPDGKVVEWAIEQGSPNTLIRRGFAKNTIQPGTIVTVEGYRSKNGSAIAAGRRVTLPDGRAFVAGSDDKGPGTGEKDY